MKIRNVLLLVVVTLVFVASAQVQAYTKEVTLYNDGWQALWSRSFDWDVSVDDVDASAWWYDGDLTPGMAATAWDLNKWAVKYTDDVTNPVKNASNYYHPAKNIDTYGIEWVDSSWSGFAPDIAKLAAYTTEGIAICQESHGYQLYRPDVFSWEDKDYFKTDARIAVENGSGASMYVQSYSYTTGSAWSSTANFTPLGFNIIPLDFADNTWQQVGLKVAKPMTAAGESVWFEIGIIGGNGTKLYIDEFSRFLIVLLMKPMLIIQLEWFPNPPQWLCWVWVV